MVRSRFSLFNKVNLLKGTTFIEILVVVGITAIVLIAMLNAAMVAIVQTKYARNKMWAGRYSQEAWNWLKAQRDEVEDWDSFINQVYKTSGGWSAIANNQKVTYCLKDLSFSQASPCQANDVISGTKFRRQMEITSDKVNNLISIEIKTGWRDGLCHDPSQLFCHQVSLKSYLTPWQD